MLQRDPRSQMLAEILLSVLLSHVWGRKTRTSPCWENQRGIYKNQSAIWQKAKCTFLQPVIPLETLSLGFSAVLMVLQGNKRTHTQRTSPEVCSSSMLLQWSQYCVLPPHCAQGTWTSRWFVIHTTIVLRAFDVHSHMAGQELPVQHKLNYNCVFYDCNFLNLFSL